LQLLAERPVSNDVFWSKADIPLKLLAWLTETFIATFGITHPTPEQQRLANFLIGGLLLVFLLVVFGVVGFMVFTISHH
jgi:hypothetical protein